MKIFQTPTVHFIPEAALRLIREYEGLRLQAYTCTAGRLTIGYGHTRGVQPQDVITEQEAELFLREDAMAAMTAIQKHVKVPLNSNQLAALISLVFNIGVTQFARSTLCDYLNKGWYEQVPPQIIRWNKVKGEALGGLTRRRQAEARLWQSTLL